VVRAVLPLGEGVVLDPFAGSGSTLAAADAVGYASIGLERDPTYFKMAEKAIPALAKLDVTDSKGPKVGSLRKALSPERTLDVAKASVVFSEAQA
jgi:hypothetical protein